MKYINTFADLATYSASTGSFSFPHVAFAVQEEQVKYDKDPSSLGYNIWGTSTGSISPRIVINGNNVVTTKMGDYFVTNWTGGTVTSLSFSIPTKDYLTSIGKLGINTSGVINWGGLFSKFTIMKYVNVNGVDTSSATNMSQMFYQCYSIKELDLSGFDTSNLTTLAKMFNDCNVLETLNLSNWNISGVTSSDYNSGFGGLFYKCGKLTSIIANNTSQDTFDKIKDALEHSLTAGYSGSPSVATICTITRDGFNWTYSGGQWVSTPV